MISNVAFDPSAPVVTADQTVSNAKLWMPQQVLFTPAALDEPFGQQIYRRVQSLGLPIEELKQNRLSGLRGEDERATYNRAKRTLAVVTAPAGQFKLQPIRKSAINSAASNMFIRATR